MSRRPPRSPLFPDRTLFRSSESLPLGVNGATISRYCASSLESIRQAANAVTAGQGDAYIAAGVDRKSTRLNSRHANIWYAVFCLKKNDYHRPACLHHPSVLL